MGSHRRPKPPSRSRLTVLAATAGTVSLLPTQSQAAPKPSIDEVRQQVEELYEAAEAPTEEYNAALVERDKLQKEAKRTQEQVAGQQQEINELRDRMGPMAAAQYRDGGLDPSVQLLLSTDPDDYLDKAARVDRMSARQVSLLSSLEAKQRTLAQTRAEAVKQLSEAEKARKRLSGKKEEIQGKLREARQLLNSLTAEQRAELEAKDAEADRAAGTSDSAATYNGPASGRARAAIEFAYAQLGKPYEWGSTGPNSYDCSGLTGAAWRAAGVSLPRTVQEQYAAGRKVAKSDLQPGDIIYWYNSSQHNGIYIGDGKAVHAPRTGKNIEITPLSYMPYFAATRP
ncbi:C40 family peptidase [Streptomyces lincolnensis]|uniref:C40 family peptidase n=1 Tax=Streptomyces lincolnensis TaxID=1915 RepID=UPI001E2BFF1B|nr:C40 family peptidase [Streptomyces lincolnensis]MCD7445142.1 C40 family peptidase [Streptomyces lincolnensis]